MNIIPSFIRHRIAHRPNLVKIIDNIGWLFIDKVVRMGVGLFVGVWVARYLGPEQFGLFNFAFAIVGMFAVCVGLGMQSIAVRDIVSNPNCKEETLGTIAFLQLIGGFFAYVCVVGTIYWLRPEDTLAKQLVAILGTGMLFRFSDIALYWFESQVLSKYIVWIQNGCFLIFAAIKVGLIMNNADILAFGWVTAIEVFMVALLIFLMFILRGLRLQKLRFSMRRVKTLLADSWPLLLSGIAIVINMRIDQVMLGEMLGDNAVGIYSAAVRVSEIWYFVIAIIMTSVFPKLAILHSEKSKLLNRRWSQAYGLMFWMSVAAAIFLSFSASFLIDILYGAEYANASSVIVIYAWAGVNVAVGTVWSYWIILENKAKISLVTQLLGACINVCLNLILIPVYGVDGAAVATLLSYMISGWTSFLFHKPKKSFKQITFGILFWKRLR